MATIDAQIIQELDLEANASLLEDAELNLEIADELLDLKIDVGSVLGLHSDGKTLVALFVNPAIKGAGPCNKKGKGVAKGKRITVPISGDYILVVKRLKLKISSVKLHKKDDPKHTVWSGIGAVDLALVGTWHVKF